MVDFLRANTWCSPEQYKWGLTVPQVRLMSYDFTHIEYLNKDKDNIGGNALQIGSVDDLKDLASLGIPVIGNK